MKGTLRWFAASRGGRSSVRQPAHLVGSALCLGASAFAVWTALVIGLHWRLPNYAMPFTVVVIAGLCAVLTATGAWLAMRGGDMARTWLTVLTTLLFLLGIPLHILDRERTSDLGGGTPRGTRPASGSASRRPADRGSRRRVPARSWSGPTHRVSDLLGRSWNAQQEESRAAFRFGAGSTPPVVVRRLAPLASLTRRREPLRHPTNDWSRDHRQHYLRVYLHR